MPIKQERVQVGTTHHFTLEVTTDPRESGRPSGFELSEAVLEVPGEDPVDLLDEGLEMPAMAERASRPSGGATTTLTAAPSYSANLGPDNENVLILVVTSSASFTVGDYVRGVGKAIVHRIVAIPDGTHIRIHSSDEEYDLEDGDTIEEVTPTGVYVGIADLDVDDFFSVAHPIGTLRMIVTTKATGDDPVFSVATPLTWTFPIELDLAGRGYKAG